MRNIRSIFTMALCLMLVALMVVGCNTPGEQGGEQTTTGTDLPPVVEQVVMKKAEYNTTTQTMPSNWNELTY